MILSELSTYKNKHHRRYFTSTQSVINYNLQMDPRRHYFNPSNAILGFGSNHIFPCSIPKHVDVYNTMTIHNTPSPYPPLAPLLPLPFPPIPPEPPPPMTPEPQQCQPTSNDNNYSNNNIQKGKTNNPESSSTTLPVNRGRCTLEGSITIPQSRSVKVNAVLPQKRKAPNELEHKVKRYVMTHVNSFNDKPTNVEYEMDPTTTINSTSMIKEQIGVISKENDYKAKPASVCISTKANENKSAKNDNCFQQQFPFQRSPSHVSYVAPKQSRSSDQIFTETSSKRCNELDSNNLSNHPTSDNDSSMAETKPHISTTPNKTAKTDDSKPKLTSPTVSLQADLLLSDMRHVLSNLYRDLHYCMNKIELLKSCQKGGIYPLGLSVGVSCKACFKHMTDIQTLWDRTRQECSMKLQSILIDHYQILIDHFRKEIKEKKEAMITIGSSSSTSREVLRDHELSWEEMVRNLEFKISQHKVDRQKKVEKIIRIHKHYNQTTKSMK